MPEPGHFCRSSRPHRCMPRCHSRGVDGSALTPTRELPAAHTGKTGSTVDPFFTTVRSELSDKGFLVATADNLISWARTGSLMWMQFGLACCAIEIGSTKKFPSPGPVKYCPTSRVAILGHPRPPRPPETCACVRQSVDLDRALRAGRHHLARTRSAHRKNHRARVIGMRPPLIYPRR
jgi:hypothetical protein